MTLNDFECYAAVATRYLCGAISSHHLVFYQDVSVYKYSIVAVLKKSRWRPEVVLTHPCYRYLQLLQGFADAKFLYRYAAVNIYLI